MSNQYFVDHHHYISIIIHNISIISIIIHIMIIISSFNTFPLRPESASPPILTLDNLSSSLE